jgi:hypothetical protein
MRLIKAISVLGPILALTMLLSCAKPPGWIVVQPEASIRGSVQLDSALVTLIMNNTTAQKKVPIAQPDKRRDGYAVTVDLLKRYFAEEVLRRATKLTVSFNRRINDRLAMYYGDDPTEPKVIPLNTATYETFDANECQFVREQLGASTKSLVSYRLYYSDYSAEETHDAGGQSVWNWKGVKDTLFIDKRPDSTEVTCPSDCVNPLSPDSLL